MQATTVRVRILIGGAAFAYVVPTQVTVTVKRFADVGVWPGSVNDVVVPAPVAHAPLLISE